MLPHVNDSLAWVPLKPDMVGIFMGRGSSCCQHPINDLMRRDRDRDREEKDTCAAACLGWNLSIYNSQSCLKALGVNVIDAFSAPVWSTAHFLVFCCHSNAFNNVSNLNKAASLPFVVRFFLFFFLTTLSHDTNGPLHHPLRSQPGSAALLNCASSSEKTCHDVLRLN